MHPGRSHTRCPFVSVSGLVILLLAESPTLTVISAVVRPPAAPALSVSCCDSSVVASEQFDATVRVGPDPLGIRAR